MQDPASLRYCLAFAATLVLACSEESGSPGGGFGAAGATPAGTGGAGLAASGGGTGLTGGSSTGGFTGTGLTGAGLSAGGATAAGGAPAGGASSGGAAGGGPRALPVACADAAVPYLLENAALSGASVPSVNTRGWGSEWFTQMPVASDLSDGRAVVGYTRDVGGTLTAVIAPLNPAGAPIEVPGAVLGGVAVTRDGWAALLFDPAAVEERTWGQVKRFAADGSEVFSSDLFRSPNLVDVGTMGEPGTSRLGYSAASDELVAYFGHTRRYDDGVRHQGGYVATLSAGGAIQVLDDWFGSHNLDQRIVTDGTRVAVVGLGDAYPKGVIFSFLEDLDTNVIFKLAADGGGAVNGQLGGAVDLGDEIVVPFVTNPSISQDLDPGAWPNQDPTISAQIEAAGDRGTDLGLLRVAKAGGLPDGDIAPVWVDVQLGSELGSEARIERVKSARYGGGALLLLSWAEVIGDGRDETAAFYTVVVDRDGTLCQPKTRLADASAPTSGDDIVRLPDGRIVWANAAPGPVQIVTLTP